MKSWKKRGLQHPTEPWTRHMLNKQLDKKIEVARMKSLIALYLAAHVEQITATQLKLRIPLVAEGLSGRQILMCIEAANLIKQEKARTIEEALELVN